MSDNKTLFQKAKLENREALLEHEAKEVLKNMGVKIPPSTLAKTEEEAVIAAESFGYPVVMKLMSSDVLHKTDAKAVIVNLNSPSEVKKTYQDFMTRFANVTVAGVLVEKMVKEGIELIIKALEKHRGKRKYAAEELGISERTLYRKIKEHNLE